MSERDAPKENADEQILPPGAFLAPFPWWVVLDGNTAAAVSAEPGSGRLTVSVRPGASAGYLMLDAADGSTCLAVFTDEDLAQRFVASAALDFPAVAAALEAPDQFLSLLDTLPRVCSYAAFDPPARVGGRARWVVGLSQVRRVLRRWADG